MKIPHSVFLAFCLWVGTVPGGAQISPEALMKVDSPDFAEGGNIPERFTCDGQDASPGLRITGVPLAARSLAIIVDDPDAPKGTFTHWLIWNLKPDLREIVTNSPPQDAVQGKNDGGKVGYMGPCPPSGSHRYYFKLYALDIALKLPAGASRKEVDAALKGHVLKEATLMGRYARPGGTRK